MQENIKEKKLEEATSDLPRTFKGDETFHTIKPTNIH